MRGLFLANIDLEGTGAVLASPDHNTPGGSYYFSWSRDAAISMHALWATRGLAAPDPAHRARLTADIKRHMQHYVLWNEKTLSHRDPNHIDIRTEVRFRIPSGRADTAHWCRPQTDGPPLVANTLALYALDLLRSGGGSDVREHLWTGNDSIKEGGLVKFHLDWVAENWTQKGCNLWEDYRSGDFFWNRHLMRAALVRGAELAEEMGDAGVARQYRSVAKDIERQTDHFNGGFVEQVSGRERDGAVIIAFNYGDLGDDHLAPLSPEVLNTVIQLNHFFCHTYKINTRDAADGVPGILYGRYEGDVYSPEWDGGNPWVLITAALAQLIYRQAAAARFARAPLDYGIDGLLRQAYGLQKGLVGRPLGDALLAVGDGVLARVRHHVEPDGFHLAEQLDKRTGRQVSATDLTWSYAEVLLAMQKRADYVGGAAP